MNRRRTIRLWYLGTGEERGDWDVGRAFKFPRWLTRRRLLITVIAIVAVGGASTWALGSWLYRAELELVRRDYSSGRADVAQARLAWMSRYWRDEGTMAYLARNVRRETGTGR